MFHSPALFRGLSTVCMAAAALALTLVSFRPAGAVADELIMETITVDHVSRTYYIQRPDEFVHGGHYPVVFILHGGNGDAKGIARTSEMRRYARSLGFMAVFPEAGSEQWNDGRETTRNNGNDVAFIGGVIDKLAERGDIDRSRAFLVGISNGGMMAQRLACDTDRFSAVAAIVANMPADLKGKCSPGKSPIVLLLGTADPLMPFGGGQIDSSDSHGSGGTVISAADTVTFWANANGCKQERFVNLPVLVEDGTHVVEEIFDSCNNAVLFYKIVGGGHAWPGLGKSTAITGVVTQNLNGTDTVLSFFAKHGLPVPDRADPPPKPPQGPTK